MIWRLGEHYSGNIEGDEDLIVHMGLAAYGDTLDDPSLAITGDHRLSPPIFPRSSDPKKSHEVQLCLVGIASKIHVLNDESNMKVDDSMMGQS